jgi:hypothetical protein
MLKFALIYLGMKKVPEEKIQGLLGNEDLTKTVDDFLSPNSMYMFLFAVPMGADKVVFLNDPPTLDKIKKKILLILRT